MSKMAFGTLLPCANFVKASPKKNMKTSLQTCFGPIWSSGYGHLCIRNRDRCYTVTQVAPALSNIHPNKHQPNQTKPNHPQPEPEHSSNNASSPPSINPTCLFPIHIHLDRHSHTNLSFFSCQAPPTQNNPHDVDQSLDYSFLHSFAELVPIR